MAGAGPGSSCVARYAGRMCGHAGCMCVCMQGTRCGVCVCAGSQHVEVGPGFNLRGTEDTQDVQGVRDECHLVYACRAERMCHM